MNRIKKDYVRKELCALALILCGMAPLLAYLVWYAGISPAAWGFLPLLAALFILRMLRQAAAGLQQICGVRSESWLTQVAEEYAAPHPICRVAYGELHLLENCLICRHKRQLLFIPVEEITHAETRYRLTGVKRVPILYLTMESGKILKIDFSARRCGDGEKAVSWLGGLLGEERMQTGEGIIA